jgi:ethanolamine utilization protein EutJ
MEWQNVNEFLEKVNESRFRVLNKTGSLKTGVDLGTAYIVITVLDEQNQPAACELKEAHVLRDGVVVDYIKALEVVKELKEKLEKRLAEHWKTAPLPCRRVRRTASEPTVMWRREPDLR